MSLWSELGGSSSGSPGQVNVQPDAIPYVDDAACSWLKPEARKIWGAACEVTRDRPLVLQQRR